MRVSLLSSFLCALSFSALCTACASRPVALPSLSGVTRVEVADYNHRLMRRIAAPHRVEEITALVDAQRDWHPPSWETPVGSLQLTFYSGSHSIAFADYGPGWLVRGFQEHPYYAALSRADDDHLLQLLGLRREDIR
jgi:hypothetical protein